MNEKETIETLLERIKELEEKVSQLEVFANETDCDTWGLCRLEILK